MGIALAIGAILLFRGVDPRPWADRALAVLHVWIDRGLVILQEAGPWAFFAAMAVLPAACVPMLAFSLTAGPAFGERMGMGAVVAAGLAATTVNLALTYWLANRALRPWLSALIARLGHKVPRVEAADMTDLIVIVRVTPGVPFFLQNYILGLADAPLGRYLAISCVIAWPYTAAFTVFGDALLHGRGRVALVAVSLFLALAAAAHLLRRHYAGRKAGA